MQQKTFIAVGALAVILLAAFLTMRAPEKGQRIGPPPRPIAAFKLADVKELEITADAGKNHVVLKEEGTDWKLTQPAAYHADQSLVKQALEQLDKLSFGDLVTENPAKFGELEVSDDKGAHIIAKDAGGKVLIDAWLGKASNGFTMLRPTGKNEVWQASGLFKYTYARDAKMWRDHQIFEFNKDDAAQLAVAAEGQKLALERIGPADKGGEVKWRVVEASVKVDPLDDSVPNGIVQSLSTLKAAEFDDTAKLADVGLDKPRIKLTVTVKGRPQILNIGNARGDDNWVSAEGRPQIYLVQKYLLERLAVKPMNFRDKTITRVKESDLVEVDVAQASDTLVLKRQGEKWAPAKGEADEGKMKGLAGAFDNLSGASFADSVDPKTTGLGKPMATVTLKLRDKSQVILKVGAQKDGTDYYVQKVGAPDVWMVKKFAADRFLKKLSDLAKSAPPPAMPPHGMGGMGMPQGMPGM